MVWLLVSTRGRKSLPGSESVSGAAGLITCVVYTQPDISLCLTMASGLDRGTKKLPWPCPCPVPPEADADRDGARWYSGGSHPMNTFPPQCFCGSTLPFDVSLIDADRSALVVNRPGYTV